MKTKEITVSLSGVIPIAAYENLRPGFSITVEPIDGETDEQIINDKLQELHQIFELEANRGKADLLRKLYANIRWYEKDGKQYPSVTSVLTLCGGQNGKEKDFHITDDELAQYAARGNAIEAVVEYYLKTGTWPEPPEMVVAYEDIAILTNGSLKFSWADCSHKAFMETYGPKIKAERFQTTVFNEEHLYAGTSDIVGEFDGVRSLMDIKSGGYDMRQLAAYAVCEQDIKQLVILLVGPTDNKCGYKKPVICDTIQTEFEAFLNARARFKQRFGI